MGGRLIHEVDLYMSKYSIQAFKNKRTKALHRLIQTSNFTCAELILSFGAPESVLVVPLTEFSIITKLNIDNIEVKNEKWIAATKSITDTE